jgi:hypothetical protein
VNEDFIAQLRRQLVDAAGRTHRLPVVSLAWLRPALVTATVVAAVVVGVIALGVPANDDEPVATGATVAFRITGGDAAAAAALLQDRLDAVTLAGTVRRPRPCPGRSGKRHARRPPHARRPDPSGPARDL